MQLVNIGFGNMVSADRVIAIVGPESAPIKRIVQDSRERGALIDATCGRKTRTVLIMDSDHVVLSALQPETVSNRFGGRAAADEPEVLDCGKYAGMTTAEARKAIVEDLKEGGYLKEVEPLNHDVGTCYRCGTTVEPMVSKQWFVRMLPLAGPAI